jgi:hypothetical protein
LNFLSANFSNQLRLTADLQWVRPADGANEEILLGGLRARITI